MAERDHRFKPMPRGRLFLATAAAAALGVLIVAGAIMPAEFNYDPLGVGKLTGISRLWAQDQKDIDPNAGSVSATHEYETGFRTDTVEIPLTSFLGGAKGSQLEYKVRLKKGGTFIYEWQAVGADTAQDFHYDFHGHDTPASPTATMIVATYKQAFGLKQQGALTAPFEGIHGWQFSNSSETPVVVRLKISGFYELIPSGQPGNEAGIIANVPAAQARPDMPLDAAPG